MRRLLAVAALLVLPAGLAAQSAERSLVIERFDVVIKVDPNADLEITETISPRFQGKWNGIFRNIPVEYRNSSGFNWRIRFDLISVTDGDGKPLKTETSRQGHYVQFKVWIPGAEDATRTLVLKYKAKNGLRFFEEHDELYWNLTGDEWDPPIEQATARIELPPGATGIRAIAFNGAYGATGRDAIVTTTGTTVSVMMPRRLESHEGVTAVIGWDKGAVTPPSGSDKVLGFLAANWPLLIPIPVFFLMYGVWRRRGRDPEPRPITVQYEAPASLTPGEAGTLTDGEVDMRDITATLVDLAVRGYLRIDEKKESKLFGLISDDEFVFVRLKNPSEWPALKVHEREVLQGVFFESRPVVELSELDNKFYKTLPGIRDGLFDALVQRGYYQNRPDKVRNTWMASGIIAGLALGVGGAILSAKLFLTPVPFVVAAVLVGAIMLFFGYHMPARTESGARALEQVKGFEEFLGRTEGDRLRDFVKTPEMFEKFLPFAMAFGVEKKWASAFKDIYTTPPSWYGGSHPGAFNAMAFSNRLSTMSTKASSSMSSAPRSSSGSGFSGGSSGGGGGGGGGGGF